MAFGHCLGAFSRQLVAFCHELGQPERAAFWEARSCRCVPLG